MKQKIRRPWVVLLVAVGLTLIALTLLLMTAPSQTVLSIKAVDAETGEPLPDTSVLVQGRGAAPLPTVTTEEDGIAWLEDVPPDSGYVVRLQKVDYFVAFEHSIVVTEGEVTELTVAIEPQPGGRLFVGLDEARVVELDTASFLPVRTIQLRSWDKKPVSSIGLHPGEELLYVVAGSEGGILDEIGGDVLERFQVTGSVEAHSVDEAVLRILSALGDDSQSTGAENSSVRVTESGRSGQLLTLDARTGALLDERQVESPNLSPLLVWRPEGQDLIVIEPSDGSLWRLDVVPKEALIYIDTGSLPKEGFRSTDGHFRYLWSGDPLERLRASFGDDLVRVADKQSFSPRPAAFSLSPIEQTLFMLNDDFGTLSVIDVTGEEPPTLVAVGKQPVALVLSSGGMWAYIANRESRSISVVHVPSLRVVQTIPIDGEPLSLTIR